MNREEVERIKNIPIIFILGKGRSGTTLLQSLLNSHPNIVAPPESKFVVMLASRFGHKRKWAESDVHSFVDYLYTEFLFYELWKIDKQKLKSFLLSAIEQLDYLLVCKMVYYFTKGDKNAIILISDKNPLYILFIKDILALFPDAKFIHLVRNPFDNLLSTKKSLGGKNATFISLQWIRHNCMVEDVKRQMTSRFYTMLYENMVNDIEGSLKGICNFINVPYSENMRTVNEKDIKERYSAELEIIEKNRKSLLEPVNSIRVNKWKKELSAGEIAITARIAGKYANTKYGYALTDLDGVVKVSRLKIVFWKIVYEIWLPFTRFRYRNYRFNIFYSKLKSRITGKNMPIWETVIE